MSETVLMLNQIGETTYCQEYPSPRQGWRWNFEEGTVWHDDEPVCNYMTSFTLFAGILDNRQMTLSLLFTTTEDEFDCITLQGVGSLSTYRGSVSSASTKYVNAIGAVFEMTAANGPFKWMLTFDQDIFQAQAVPRLSEEIMRRFRFRAFPEPPFP